MADVFTVFAAVCIIASVLDYLIKLFRGRILPNPVTWVITSVAMTLNNLTYFTVTGGRLKENVAGLLVNASLFVVAAKSFQKGRPDLTKGDVAVFAAAVIIGIVWRVSGDAFIANVALQGVLLLSFWPTFIGLLEGRLRDHPLPWLLAVASYGFQILTIVTNRPDWTWHVLIFPVANGIIGNGSIAFAAWRQNVQLQTQSAPSSS